MVFFAAVIEWVEVVFVLGAHEGGRSVDKEVPQAFFSFIEGCHWVARAVSVWRPV